MNESQGSQRCVTTTNSEVERDTDLMKVYLKRKQAVDTYVLPKLPLRSSTSPLLM